MLCQEQPWLNTLVPTIRSSAYVLYNNNHKNSDQGLWQFHPDIIFLFILHTLCCHKWTFGLSCFWDYVQSIVWLYSISCHSLGPFMAECTLLYCLQLVCFALRDFYLQINYHCLYFYNCPGSHSSTQIITFLKRNIPLNNVSNHNISYAGKQRPTHI